MIIGFCNGVFDLYHEGHQHFLTECRKHCGYLICAVNTDEWTKRTKGPERPYDSLWTRMAHVRTMAEAVIPFEGNEEPLILNIRPNVVLKGSDHSPNQTHYAQRVPGWKTTRNGIWYCPVIHISRLEGYSTTSISRNVDAVLRSRANAEVLPGLLPKEQGKEKGTS